MGATKPTPQTVPVPSLVAAPFTVLGPHPCTALQQIGPRTFLVDRIPRAPSRKRVQALPKPGQKAVDTLKSQVSNGRVLAVFGTITCNGCGCNYWWTPWPKRKGKVTAADLDWRCWACTPPEPDPRAPYDPQAHRPCIVCGTYLGVRYTGDDRCTQCRTTSWNQHPYSPS